MVDIDPSFWAKGLLFDYVVVYGEEKTKDRSLSLLGSRRGVNKWHGRHYGYPLKMELFDVYSVRRIDGFERKIFQALGEKGEVA